MITAVFYLDVGLRTYRKGFKPTLVCSHSRLQNIVFFFLNCFSSVSYISHLQSVPSIPKFTLSSWLLNDYYFFFILAFDMRLFILGFPYMRTL